MTSESMAKRVPITVPDLGAGDDKIRISAWLVDVGQTVVAGDNVVEVLVPGITFDIQASQTGELIELVKAVDEFVAPNDIVGWIAVD
ncbi:MAG TPA: lipoyl domain-containing protein [Schlesneria sp.]|jgi:pyruvate/2-oxoglutarate dehydrogenase complex dihydrolipoamide acyltransferase (E2) component